MKTVIKKGIKIYSPRIKKQKKGKGSLQAICKNKRRVFLCFFPEDPGKKAADPGGAYCGSSSGYPFVSAWNLYLAWNNGSVPGAGTCENISASERTGAWYVCQCGKRGFRGEHADRSTFFRCLHRLRKSTSSGARGWRSSESGQDPDMKIIRFN